jgi:hypothetical protein
MAPEYETVCAEESPNKVECLTGADLALAVQEV